MSSLTNNLQVAPQEIYTSSSTQGTNLGALATTGDGRYFRYVLAGGTTIVVGTLQQSPAQDTTNLNPSGGLAVGAATATGANSFNINASITLTANQLAGAIMGVDVTPGVGNTYKVKSNTAVSSATGATIVLEDPLVTNLSTSSRVVFALNPYSGIIENPATATGTPVGVSVYPITNAQYGWVQVLGPVACLIGATAGTIGQGYVPGSTTGSVAGDAGAGLAQVGYAINAGVATESDIIFAKLS